MPKRKCSRISAREWQAHKATIQRLYLSEDKSLMGESGVIETMKKKGFSASKPQYEAQFMRWGFKKKLTRETWHIIGHIIKNRDEAERVSHVYAYGTRISRDKVKKETARYKTCDKNEECCTKQVLPTGIEVRSDDEEVEETMLSLEVQDTHSNNTSATRTPIELHAPRAPLDPAPSPDPFQEIDQVFDGKLLVSLPSPAPFDSFDSFDTVTILENASVTSYSQSIPFNRRDNFARHSSLGTSRLEKAYFTPMNTITLFTNLNTALFREFRALLKDDSAKIFTSINQIRHLLPSESNQLQKASVDLVILKQIFYLLMNNFAGSDYAVFDTIFEQVRQFSIAHMEDMLDALPHPYAAALQQSILTIAIKSNIPMLVEIILRRGLDSNGVTCRFGGQEFTPLGLACKFRRLEVVKVLLCAGADPNRTVHHDPDRNPISHLFGSIDEVDHEDATTLPVICSILERLLDHHATMNWINLGHEKFWEAETLVDIFIHHNRLPVDFNCSYVKSSIERAFGMIKAFGRQEKVTAIIQSILGNESGLQNWNPIYKQPMTELLQNASYKGNLSLIDFLLDRLGLTPDSTCLCEAVRGNQSLLVTKYIQIGVRIDEPSHFSHSQKPLVENLSSNLDPYLLEGYSLEMAMTTPFAEAIRWGNQDMVDLLKSWGVFNTIADKENLHAAILAAVEMGKKDLIQELSSINKGSLWDTLKLPLTKISGSTLAFNSSYTSILITAAVLRGHQDMVELLMAAGIQPDSTSIAAAVLIRNIQLFELFLDTAVCISASPGLGILAARWGSQHVLKLLVVYGMDFNETGMNLGYLRLHSLQPESKTTTLSKGWKRTEFSPLTEAIKKGDPATFQLLLDNGADYNAVHCQTKTSPLEEAINRGHEEFAQKLLSHGADLDDPGALQAAVKMSHKLAGAILELHGKRYPNHNRNLAVPALREAIKKQDEKTVRLLAMHAAVNRITFQRLDVELPNACSLPSPLGEGIATGSIRIVQILLESGGDPNSTVEAVGNRPGWGRLNAVLKAISTGNLTMVEVLHNAGADLRFSATVGITHTSLQLAVDLGHFEIVQYLLNQGVNVNAPPCIWGGGTALQFAAKTGSVRIAEMLFERGAEINHPGSKYIGRTAFEFAAENGRIDMLLWLFHHGVDIVSDGGEQVRTACWLAEKNGQIAARDLVEQLGIEAQQNIPSTSYQTFW